MTTALERHPDFSAICGSCVGWHPIPDHPYEWRATGHHEILFDVRAVEHTLMRRSGYPYRVRGGRKLKPQLDRSGTWYYRLGIGRAGHFKWLSVNAATLERLTAATHAAADAAEAA